MAGSGWKVFQAGAVLPASEVNGYLMDQSVMVFAGTAARGSAVGTAVAEGMASYRKDADYIEVYNGTAWVPSSGVTLISPTSIANASGTATATGGEVSFSGVTSVSLNGVFSSAFDRYQVVLRFTNSTTAGNTLKLRASGTNTTDSLYYLNGPYATDATVGAYNDPGAASFSPVVSSQYKRKHWEFDFIYPFAADYTSMIGIVTESNTTATNTAAVGGWHISTTSYDGFTLAVSTGTTAGFIRVYGYRNS